MKQLKLFVPVLISILVCATSNADAQTRVPKADTQNWNEIQLAVPLGKDVDFIIQGMVRIGGNLSRAVDHRWGVGFNYKAGKFVTLNQLYFHREARPLNGQHEVEERLSAGATLMKQFGNFVLSDRNWVERRWREPQVDAWRYRNRLQLTNPFKINRAEFIVFVSDEVFYDWSQHDWVRNRFAVGARRAFNKHFTGDLYFMRQNDGRSRPGDLNIIGTVMRFRL